MAVSTPLPATPSSYIQPLTLTIGELLQSTYREFELSEIALSHLDTQWGFRDNTPVEGR
jgi:hypothetical protein